MRIKRQAQQKFKRNPRFQALIILDQIENQQQYSNVVIDRFLNANALDDRDQRLVVQLVYGTMQHRLTIDYYLADLLHKKKIDAWVRTLLRMTVYQIVYLDRVPSRAAVNEAVEIAKINGHRGLGGFVNAILRQFLRQDLPTLTDIEDPVERLSIQYSLQPWIVQELLAQHSVKRAESILKSTLAIPFVSARINRPLDEHQKLLDELTDEGYQVEASPLSPYGIRALKGNLIHSAAFKRGDLTIQDESSMLVAPLGQLQGDEIVLDACAAPGGKATHIGSLLDEGNLLALDISENKLKRVEKHIERLGLTDRIQVQAVDATTYEPVAGQKYDRIYIDAPCSALGLLRRHPEVKYDKASTDATELSHLQKELMEHLSTYVAVGGQLIYSTCTITTRENEAIIADFLKRHPEFSLHPILASEGVPEELINEHGQLRVWPDQHHTDGFFVARLMRNK